MSAYRPYEGIIIQIDNVYTNNKALSGCIKKYSIVNQNGDMIYFIVSSQTYILYHIMLNVGDSVICFYDANSPVPLIYPAQLNAVVIAKMQQNQNVTVDYFDNELVNANNTLKLNIAKTTNILLTNGQKFVSDPANHNLVVVYGPTTRSIPAQTTPTQIVVLC